MPAATPVQRLRRRYAGGVVEVNIWRVPTPVAPCTHPYKYRLAYVVAGQRVIGFDNERGKGDHEHGPAGEMPYRFISVEALLRDFWAAIAAYGGGK